MKNKIVTNQPQKVTTYPEITPSDQDAVECVNEIFKSPLTGAYNWDYVVVEDRIKKLYELGKRLNWNVEFDLDWNPLTQRSVFHGHPLVFAFANCKYCEALEAFDETEFALFEESVFVFVVSFQASDYYLVWWFQFESDSALLFYPILFDFFQQCFVFALEPLAETLQ